VKTYRPGQLFLRGFQLWPLRLSRASGSRPNISLRSRRGPPCHTPQRRPPMASVTTPPTGAGSTQRPRQGVQWHFWNVLIPFLCPASPTPLPVANAQLPLFKRESPLLTAAANGRWISPKASFGHGADPDATTNEENPRCPLPRSATSELPRGFRRARHLAKSAPKGSKMKIKNVWAFVLLHHREHLTPG